MKEILVALTLFIKNDINGKRTMDISQRKHTYTTLYLLLYYLRVT